MNYYLGFDAGTQSVKVAVYDEDMNCIVSSSAPTTLTYPEPGWVSMDVDEYLALTIKGMKECASQMKEKGLDVTKIKSIMGDGVICGICGVDKDGNAITPYINYLDSRTKEDVELVNSWELEIFGKETGNPEANCMFPAMFARWFLKNIEGFKENGAKFIHDAPYVLAHLAGLSAKDMFVDWGTMSGWGLGYKVEEKCWSKEQLDILGIPEEMMPRIVKPWDIIGHLTEEIAQETGCAIILIGHLNKAAGMQSLQRGLGSIDIAAAVRSVMFIGKLKHDPTMRILTHEKSSLAPPGVSLAFSLGDEGGFRWVGEYDITADEMLSGIEPQRETKTQQAKDLICALLAGGKQVLSEDIDKAALERGIPGRTVRDAKRELGDALKSKIVEGRKKVFWME